MDFEEPEKVPSRDEKERLVLAANEAASKYGWQLSGLRFTFVDRFEATSFKKTSARGIRGHRIFDLRDQELGLSPVPDSARVLADQLKDKAWS